MRKEEGPDGNLKIHKQTKLLTETTGTAVKCHGAYKSPRLPRPLVAYQAEKKEKEKV